MQKHVLKRICNAFRCYRNYALSRLGLVRISHMPVFVSVEPANICQLRCPECPVWRGQGGRLAERDGRLMSRDVWERVLAETAQTAWVMQFYFQGEPLLHKGLPQMIQEAHEAGLYTIVSTNAQAMTPEMADALVGAGLNRIIVSMDGLTEASYNAYRVGGSLQKTKEALRLLRNAKERFHGHTTIELQCLRLKTNEHEWEEFKRAYKALGADRMVFKTAQLYDYKNGHSLMPSQPRYSRYAQGEDGFYHRKDRGKGCLRVWSGVVVTTDGEVLPCCYDKGHSYAYGNIMAKPLRELISNEKALAFRKAVLQEQPAICKECWK